MAQVSTGKSLLRSVASIIDIVVPSSATSHVAEARLSERAFTPTATYGWLTTLVSYGIFSLGIQKRVQSVQIRLHRRGADLGEVQRQLHPLNP